MEIMPKKIEERAGEKHMFSSQVSSKLLCSAFCSVISTPVNILPSSLGIMSLIVHARYVFWMVSGELAETVSTCSGHLPRSVGHFMYPRRRRATSYTFTLFALLQKFKWHHKKGEGGRESLSVYRAFIHCHIRISVLFTYAKKGD